MAIRTLRKGHFEVFAKNDAVVATKNLCCDIRVGSRRTEVLPDSLNFMALLGSLNIDE